MGSNFNRGGNFKREQLEEPGEIVLAPPSVQDCAMLVCCGRLETGLDHEDFKRLVDELIESVRHDERQRAQVVVAIAGSKNAMNAPTIRTKLMDLEGEQAIAKLLESAPRTETGKLRQGWAAMVGAELGYTVQQVQSVIHKLKKGSR